MKRLLSLILLLPMVGFADLPSRHSRQDSGLGAGYAYLMDAGCKRPSHTETQMNTLTKDGSTLQLIGSTITFKCLDNPDILKVVNNITLAWTAPTTREDRSPLTSSDISGYEIYHLHSSGDNVIILQAPADQYTITDVPSGEHLFSIAAVDKDQLRSEQSGYVRATI